jgi:hypothetical protein
MNQQGSPFPGRTGRNPARSYGFLRNDRPENTDSPHFRTRKNMVFLNRTSAGRENAVSLYPIHSPEMPL